MIAPGSVIGFGLVFIGVTWLTSALLGGVRYGLRDRIRALGPRAERRAASIALALPVLFGAAVATGLAGLSLVGPRLGLADHCLAHGHHLHLCLRHGSHWTTESWAVALTAAVAGLLCARLARAVYERWNATRQLRSLRSVSISRTLVDGTDVVYATSRRPFCFTAGLLSPRIYVGSAALEQLTPAQQRAMLAHERAHIQFGDLWRGSALSLLALLGAPGFARAALRAWRSATERLCDRVAADTVGSTATVASAILEFAHAYAPAPTPSCAFIPHPGEVVDRVEAVLGNAPRGDRAARSLAIAAGVASLALLASAALLADPLHHAIETLLGSL